VFEELTAAVLGEAEGIAAASKALAALHGLTVDVGRPPRVLQQRLAEGLRHLDEVAEQVVLLRRDGGFVRAGFHEGIDEARELGSDSRRYVAALQARYAEETGPASSRAALPISAGRAPELASRVARLRAASRPSRRARPAAAAP
jgi:DNA mismatch repair ATPase MutS